MATKDRNQAADPAWVGYAAALLCVLLTAIVRHYAIGQVQAVFFVGFFPALIVTSLYWGIGPGLFALVLTTAYLWLAVLPGIGGVERLQPSPFLALATFYFSAVFVVVACSAKHRGDRRNSDLARDAIRKEHALAGKEQLLRLITDAAPALISYIDAEERFVFVNSAYEQWFEQPRDKIVGCHLKDVLGDLYATSAPHVKLVLQGNPSSFDRLISDSTGRQRYIHVSYAPDRGPDGQTVGFVAVITDLTDIHLADASLRASERLASKRLAEIDNVYRNAPAGLCFLDADLRFIRLNERLADLTGISIEEHLGKTIREVIGSRADLIEPLCRRVLDTGEPVHDHEISIESRHSPGDRLLIVVNLEPVYGPNRDLLGVNGVVADMTAIRRSEQALVASEERYRDLVESASEGIWVINGSGTTEFANRAMSQMLGVAQEDLPGLSAKEFFFQDDNAAVRTLISPVVGEHWQETDLRLRRADGSGIWARCTAQPRFDERGRLTSVTALVNDVTERKRGEDRQRILGEASHVLSRSLDYEATMRDLASFLVPDFADWCTVHVRDGDELRPLAVAHVNPEKVRWAQELQRRFPPDLNAPTGMAKVLRTGQPEFYPEITVEMLEAAGIDEERMEIIRQIGFTSALIVPLIARGRTIGAITLVTAESLYRYTESDLAFAEQLATRAAIAIDNARLFAAAQREISERIEAEREIRRLNAELEHRVEERTAELRLALADLEGFCYTVSHDLRAPMRSISGNSMIILEEYGDRLDDSGRQTLDRLSAAGARMGKLIDDLLQFSRLGRTALQRKPVDLSAMAESVAEEALADGRQPASVTVQPDMHVEADPVMLRIVLQNLIENAVKYSSRSQDPRVEVGRTDGEASPVFFVRDNGIGFDMEYVEKIFQPFERLHREAEYPGTGIGLANVRRIVHRHGGRVWAESKSGSGSTFYFTLPSEEEAAKDGTISLAPPSYLS